MPWWGIALVGVGGAAIGAGAVYVGVMIAIGKALQR